MNNNKKKRFGNLKLKGYTEDNCLKTDNHCVTYLRKFCKWMTKHGVGVIVREQTILRVTNDGK